MNNLHSSVRFLHCYVQLKTTLLRQNDVSLVWFFVPLNRICKAFKYIFSDKLGTLSFYKFLLPYYLCISEKSVISIFISIKEITLYVSFFPLVELKAISWNFRFPTFHFIRSWESYGVNKFGSHRYLSWFHLCYMYICIEYQYVQNV